jgi:hypothetical protein
LRELKVFSCNYHFAGASVSMPIIKYALTPAITPTQEEEDMTKH